MFRLLTYRKKVIVRRHTASKQRGKVGSISIAVHLDTMRLQLQKHQPIK